MKECQHRKKNRLVIKENWEDGEEEEKSVQIGEMGEKQVEEDAEDVGMGLHVGLAEGKDNLSWLDERVDWCEMVCISKRCQGVGVAGKVGMINCSRGSRRAQDSCIVCTA